MQEDSQAVIESCWLVAEHGTGSELTLHAAPSGNMRDFMHLVVHAVQSRACHPWSQQPRTHYQQDHTDTASCRQHTLLQSTASRSPAYVFDSTVYVAAMVAQGPIKNMCKTYNCMGSHCDAADALTLSPRSSSSISTFGPVSVKYQLAHMAALQGAQHGFAT